MSEWKDFSSEIYLEPGDYILTFSDVDGYVTPDPMVINMQYNRLINVVYEPQKYNMSFEVGPSGFDGKVRVIDPSGVIEDTWRPLTETISLPNNTYVVMFDTQPGYKTPRSQSVTIDNAPKVVWVNYEEDITEYKVTFTTNVTTASATLKDSEGNASIIVIYDGMSLTLKEGTYTITFENVTGMTAPAPLELNVIEDLNITVEYMQN